MNFTGQNYGARRFDNIRKISQICLGIVTILGLFAGGLMTLFGEPLLHIYIKDSPESIHYGVIRLCIVVLPYFLGGMMEVTTGLLRGMGTSILPMIISLVGVCGFRVFWIFTILPNMKTPQMLYLSYPVSWILTFTVQYITYRIVLRKKEREFQEQPERIILNGKSL
jgi:Na+-driven multidrug efflux pump